MSIKIQNKGDVTNMKYDELNIVINVVGNQIKVDFSRCNTKVYPLTDSIAQFLGVEKINNVDIAIKENEISINADFDINNNYYML